MKTQQNGKWCFTEQKKTNLIKEFILQIRENTCSLVEKWTEGGISGLGEKSQIINIIKEVFKFTHN